MTLQAEHAWPSVINAVMEEWRDRYPHDEDEAVEMLDVLLTQTALFLSVGGEINSPGDVISDEELAEALDLVRHYIVDWPVYRDNRPNLAKWVIGETGP